MEKKLSDWGYKKPEIVKTIKEDITPFSENIFDSLSAEYFTDIEKALETRYPFIMQKMKFFRVYEMFITLMLESFKLGLKLHMDYLDFAEKKIKEMKTTKGE